MVIYVVSDTHGHVESFLGKVEEIGLPDKIFFLGDYTEDVEKIKNVLGNIEIIAVKGNNDFLDREYKNEEILNIQGHKIFLTHGHLYDVNFDISNLYYRGRELEADMVFFGHTHKATNIVEDDIILLNPGSPSFPRSRSKEKTFIKLTVSNGLEYEFIKI